MLTPTQTIELFTNNLDHKTIKAGEIIFTEGESGTVMYGLLQGEIDVIVNNKVVETITAGDIFGISVLVHTEQKRASTTQAKTDCQIVVIDKEKFLFFVQETPLFALEALRSYSDRLIKLKHNI